jgi:hypothetical protein
MTHVDHLVYLASAALAGGLSQGRFDKDQDDWEFGNSHIALRAAEIASQTLTIILENKDHWEHVDEQSTI